MTFALSQLPVADLRWGKKLPGRSDKSEWLHIRDKPVFVWIVGEVGTLSFYKDGYPQRKQGILVQPLVERNFTTGVSIVDGFSKPKGNYAAGNDGLWAARWMTNRGVSQQDVSTRTSSDCPLRRLLTNM